MKRPTLFPAIAVLCGVVLAWNALAPATPYSGTLAATGGGLGDYCVGTTQFLCTWESPECVDTYIEVCTGYTTSGRICEPADEYWKEPCTAHCSWQYCPTKLWEECNLNW